MIAVTLQAADQGDTTTIHSTLAETAENLAQLIEREAEKAPEQEPQVSLDPLAEVVADKGYHSNETIVAIQQAEARSYIPEPQREHRNWTDKAAEQKAVYANRRRITGRYGKRLLKKRGELIERSFAHCYETGGLRRVHLRGRENVLKRQLIHVGAFNLSLIFRHKLGAGTPRELCNRAECVIFVNFELWIVLETNSAGLLNSFRGFLWSVGPATGFSGQNCLRQIWGGCTTGC